MENRLNNSLHDTASIEQAKLQCFSNLMCIYAASEISTNLCRSRLSEHRKKNLSSCSLASCSFFPEWPTYSPHERKKKKREKEETDASHIIHFLSSLTWTPSNLHHITSPVTRHTPIHWAVNHADLVRSGATRGGNGRERQRKRKRNGSGRKTEREKPDKSTECIYVALL